MTMQELQADAKLVYNASDAQLVALADKYTVSTRTLAYAKAHPDYAAGCTFKSNGDIREIRSLLYATIKGRVRNGGN